MLKANNLHQCIAFDFRVLKVQLEKKVLHQLAQKFCDICEMEANRHQNLIKVLMSRHGVK